MKTITLMPTVLMLFNAILSFSQAGNLDNSFNKNGYVITMVGASSSATAVAVQRDGKILVAGNSSNGSNNDIVLVRYRPNGKADTSFGINGIVITDRGGNESAYSTAVLPNGKILVAGGIGSDFALLRYNKNGSLDSSFGINGIRLTDFNNHEDIAYSLALQTDGKIVVGGLGGTSDVGDVVLARYKSNGALDTSFGIKGKVTVRNLDPVYHLSIAIQHDGKIIASGTRYHDFLAMRFNIDGSLDSSFAKNGKAVTNILDLDFGYAMAIFPDDKFIVVGESANPPDYSYFSLEKYKANGKVDKPFGNNGNVQTYFFDDYNNAYDQAAFAVLVQADGKIVVAGEQYRDFIFALARYLPNGNLDSSFGNNGKVLSYAGMSVQALAQQTDGKIIAVGSGRNGEMTVARYIADDTLVNKTSSDVSLKSLKENDFNTPRIYPNPFQDVLNIQFNSSSFSGKTISIYDMNGKLLLSKHVEGNTRLDIKHLVNGSYLTKINDESGKELYRGIVVKQ